MKAALVFAVAQFKRSLRDPLSLFFIILFPLIFLFVFGTIFGNSADASFKVAVFDHAKSDFSEQFTSKLTEGKAFKISSDIENIDLAKDKMSRGELDSIIELPKTFGEVKTDQDTLCEAGTVCSSPQHPPLPSGEVIVYYSESSPEAGRTVASVMEGILSEINSSMTSYQAPFTVKPKTTSQSGLSQFDYTFAGLLAFTLMSMGIYILAQTLPSDKKTGALRRIRSSPFRSWQLILGMALNYIALSLISVTVMILAAVLVFHFNMRGDWLTLAIFSIISIAMFCGIGMIIAGWARNDNQAALLSQSVAMPMMFLSGVFFPRFLMPEWLQGATSWIPMTPVGEAVRLITTEHASLIAVAPQLGLVAIWGIVAYAIAFKVFRWE